MKSISYIFFCRSFYVSASKFEKWGTKKNHLKCFFDWKLSMRMRFQVDPRVSLCAYFFCFDRKKQWSLFPLLVSFHLFLLVNSNHRRCCFCWRRCCCCCCFFTICCAYCSRTNTTAPALCDSKQQLVVVRYTLRASEWVRCDGWDFILARICVYAIIHAHKQP